MPRWRPPGKHVASLFVPARGAAAAGRPQLGGPAREAAFADLVIETVTRHAPNFQGARHRPPDPVAARSRAPLRHVDGDIFHGALSLDQLFSARPVLGYADYRMPVPGLYLCGSGAHPGGGVTGVPGHNAAREIIADLKGWRATQWKRA